MNNFEESELLFDINNDIINQIEITTTEFDTMVAEMEPLFDGFLNSPLNNSSNESSVVNNVIINPMIEVSSNEIKEYETINIDHKKSSEFEYSGEIHNNGTNSNEAEEMVSSVDGTISENSTNPNCNIERGNNNIHDQELIKKQDENHKIINPILKNGIISDHVLTDLNYYTENFQENKNDLKRLHDSLCEIKLIDNIDSSKKFKLSNEAGSEPEQEDNQLKYLNVENKNKKHVEGQHNDECLTKVARVENNFNKNNEKNFKQRSESPNLSIFKHFTRINEIDSTHSVLKCRVKSTVEEMVH